MDELYGVGMAEVLISHCWKSPLLLTDTGSEGTPISIVTTGECCKKGVLLLPDWAGLDGELTLSVPPHITAATGIDAMVHAIEAYTCKMKKNSLLDPGACEALISTVATRLPAATCFWGRCMPEYPLPTLLYMPCMPCGLPLLRAPRPL